MLEEFVLLLDRLEAPTLQRRGLRVADRVLDATLAIRVTDPRRVGHHAVMGERGGVHGVQFRLVQVGLDDALLEVVQHDVAAAAAEVAPSLLVQSRPGLLAGLPDHPPVAAPRIPQRHHEQPRLAVPLGARHAGRRTFTVVDLDFLAGGELQPVELFWFARAQPAHEALDAVVCAVEAEPVDQVLVDRHGVAVQPDLGLDELAVRLACRGRRDHRSRWPGWGNLLCRAGGHPGGICPLLGQPLLVRTDRLAVDTGDALNLALTGTLGQQRRNRRLQMWLQDVHSRLPS